jgi:hypothetical protein
MINFIKAIGICLLIGVGAIALFALLAWHCNGNFLTC